MSNTDNTPRYAKKAGRFFVVVTSVNGRAVADKSFLGRYDSPAGARSHIEGRGLIWGGAW